MQRRQRQLCTSQLHRKPKQQSQQKFVTHLDTHNRVKQKGAKAMTWCSEKEVKFTGKTRGSVLWEEREVH